MYSLFRNLTSSFTLWWPFGKINLRLKMLGRRGFFWEEGGGGGGGRGWEGGGGGGYWICEVSSRLLLWKKPGNVSFSVNTSLKMAFSIRRFMFNQCFGSTHVFDGQQAKSGTNPWFLVLILGSKFPLNPSTLEQFWRNKTYSSIKVLAYVTFWLQNVIWYMNKTQIKLLCVCSRSITGIHQTTSQPSFCY